MNKQVIKLSRSNPTAIHLNLISTSRSQFPVILRPELSFLRLFCRIHIEKYFSFIHHMLRLVDAIESASESPNLQHPQHISGDAIALRTPYFKR